ncbi:alpha-ketoglutarate-dependent dioxygenase AlkB family protein [Paraburkholderia sp. 32]|uniref:alpha-ketoglutarate-dependent dioxygenase AlkB family protein n=1 Tax=Paraburkholderia sp. 32 TaxID=2991057 RepID=UPI003D1B589D
MLSQQDLFEPAPVSLVTDIGGGIRYLPNAISTQRAEDLFNWLLQNASWRGHRRMMYERDVAVPRLSADYADDGSCRLAKPLGDAFAIVRELVAAPFNIVGLNLYRDENDSVAPHSDKVVQLVHGQPIAILSLGATRRMSVRDKTGSTRVRHVELEAASLLVMSYESQLTHEHGIPKLSGTCGPRISLAFRCYKSE